MKGSRVLGLCIVGISLAACQPACCWVKADITQTEADRDSYECRRDAAHQTAAYLHTPQSGGSYLSVPLQSTDYDESLYSQCMAVRGYQWVQQGAEQHRRRDRTFNGVGVVIGVKNERLAWDVAENRARAELSKIIETYASYLQRTYTTSISASDLAMAEKRQTPEQITKLIANAGFSRVRVNRHFDGTSGRYQVTASLPLEEMREAWGETGELSSDLKDFLRRNSVPIFDRLEAESASR